MRSAWIEIPNRKSSAPRPIVALHAERVDRNGDEHRIDTGRYEVALHAERVDRNNIYTIHCDMNNHVALHAKRGDRNRMPANITPHSAWNLRKCSFMRVFILIPKYTPLGLFA